MLSQLSKITPLPSSIMGYITSGNFSLSRGEGFGIGAVSLVQYLDVIKQGKDLLVKVRDRQGQVCRLAVMKL